MILALTLVSTSLLWQAVEHGTPPQIDAKPNQDVLNTILGIPSAKVSAIVRGGEFVGPVFKIGGDVTPPHLKSQTQPEFPEDTRKAKHTGIVVIRLIVGTDGRVHNARVVRHAGWGESATAFASLR
jgi:hypothetical protein